MFIAVAKTKLSLVKGDITKQDTEAIVNAANSTLLGGGGVDGAIHQAGGPEILEACKKIRTEQGGCPAGKAVITTGGRLPAKYVIHTVGPVWTGGKANEPQLLSNCYKNSLSLAKNYHILTIAFPSISTGVYRYPVQSAAEIALSTILEVITRDGSFAEVRMVLFNDIHYETYKSVLLGLKEL